MSATPVEQPGQDKDLRVGAADVAQAAQAERLEDLARSASARDYGGIAARGDGWSDAERTLFSHGLSSVDARYLAACSPAAVLALLARLEAAEGEGARLRRTLEATLDPSWWREDVDVNGEYTTSRALGYYELVPRIQEALAQSKGLPS